MMRVLFVVKVGGWSCLVPPTGSCINDGFIDGSSIDGMLHSVMRAEDEAAIAQAANTVLPVATDAWSPGGG